MPEGPSIVILCEQVLHFERKKVIAVSGNSKIDQFRIRNQKVLRFRSWGKHFLICFPDFFLRVHFLMWGSYRISEEKDAEPRLRLTFRNGILNLYSCSIRIVEGIPDDVYDWSGDVMNPLWNPAGAIRKLKRQPELLACDSLLDQNIFSGVGNIIKNEVLFSTSIHPLSIIGQMPPAKVKMLVKEASDYSFEFLFLKLNYVLKANFQAHNRKICPRCNIPFVRKHLGKYHRRSFYCTNCQVLYQ